MSNAESRVTVIDVEIPFWRLVAFLLKLALAAIPASILFVIILAVIFGLLRLIGVGLMMSSVQL
jgi:hypothetical protein